MNLDKIQEMWQKDSVIDPDNLHDESLRLLCCVKKQETHTIE